MSPTATQTGFISQFDDPTTVQDGLNCTSASFTMLGWYASGKRLWPGDFRRLQSDREGGISIPDGARAWPLAFPTIPLRWSAANDGVPIPAGRVGDGATEAELWDLLALDYQIVWQGDYDVIEAAGASEQIGFRDPHAFIVTRRRLFNGRPQGLVMDPLVRYSDGDYAGRWIDWSALVAYGRKLTGRSVIYAAWARPRTPDVATPEEDMAGLIIEALEAVSGTIKMGAGHSAVQVATKRLVQLPAGDTKTVVAKGRLDPPLDAQLGNPPQPGDRSSVYLIGDEAAVVLQSDGMFTAAPSADRDAVLTEAIAAVEAIR